MSNTASWMNDALHVIDKLTHYSKEGGSGSNDYKREELDKVVGGEGNEETAQRKKRIDQYLSEQLNSINDGQQVLPVIVGGTMMYLQWLVHGRPDAMKPSEDAVKKATAVVTRYQKEEEKLIQQQEQEENDDTNKEDQGLETKEKENTVEDSLGWKAAIEHISSLGPTFADRAIKLSGKDWYRLRRTLEVAYTVLDDPENKVKIEEIYNGQREGGLDSMEYDVRCFFLCPDDRMTHTGVVDSRCEDMIEKGLINETADLRLSGLLPEGGQQARAIGYRQTLDYLNRKEVKEEDPTAFASYLDGFTGATRRYAKKQMQWFRRDEKFVFVPVKLSDPSNERVETSAKIIRDICVLSRKDFEKGLNPPEENSNEDNFPISAKTKIENEKQGKTMKFYRGKRHKLIEGTDVFKKMISDADECTSRMQHLLNQN